MKVNESELEVDVASVRSQVGLISSPNVIFIILLFLKSTMKTCLPPVEAQATFMFLSLDMSLI